MRTVVVGDVHGCYEQLKALISELEKDGNYTPDADRLIFLGDYIDRGPDSRKCVGYL